MNVNGAVGKKFTFRGKKYNILELMEGEPEGKFFPRYVKFNGKNYNEEHDGTIETVGDIQLTFKTNEPQELEYVNYIVRGVKLVLKRLKE